MNEQKKRITRRTFCTQAGLIGGSVLAATGALNAAPRKSNRYIDMHTHLGQTWNSTEYLSAEVMLRWMDSTGIEQAVVLPLVSPESSSYPL
ncbi:MAG: amidohydrolase, partial [Planctomycetota bacterium]|nr:amidohydrolase [Planctomycetota bacterium]